MTIQDKLKIYIESSTISYLTARPTEEPIRKAKQVLTRQWWQRRESFDLYISQTVVDEIRLGDKVAAGLRIDAIKGISILELVPAIQPLAKALLQTGAIPVKSEADAVHVAYAAIHGLDILLTWNQKHIATDMKRRFIEAVILDFGFRLPRLLTPEQHLLSMEN
jgi:predicted nucleic acid-binding protein